MPTPPMTTTSTTSSMRDTPVTVAHCRSVIIDAGSTLTTAVAGRG